MGEVAGQGHRDLAIFRAWVDGAHQDELAAQYGVTQQAISQAVGRVLDQVPEPDKAEEVRRSLRLMDELLAVYAPKAKAGNPAANREIRGLLALKGRYLGIDRREIHVEGTIEHEHQLTRPEPVPAVPVAELLERWSREGRLKIRGELVRLDQEANP